MFLKSFVFSRQKCFKCLNFCAKSISKFSNFRGKSILKCLNFRAKIIINCNLIHHDNININIFFCGWDLCVRYGYLLLSNSRKSENSQLKSFAASKKYSFQIMKKSGEISYEVVRGYCTYQYVIRIIMYHNNFLIRFKILRCDGSTLIKARMSTSAGIAKLQGLDTCHED